MSTPFFLGRLPWLGLVCLGCITLNSVRAQPCAYLPPGGPLAFGLHSISQVQVDSQVADSPLWLDDGRVVIGAALSSQAGYRRGAVWVYPRHATSLNQVNSFILPPLEDIASGVGGFGRTLATSGPWLAATARLKNDSHTVCLFEATNETDWSFRTNLLGVATADADAFGAGLGSVAMHGRWLAVIRHATSGRVHLYRVNDAGVWEERQLLAVPGFQTTALPLSAVVELHDRTLVAGVSQNGLSSSFTGEAHVWRRGAGDVWEYETSLTPENLAAGDRFGTSVALGENRVFVSSTRSDAITTDGGAIHLFERHNDAWTETTMIAPDNLVSPQFIGAHIAYSSLGGEYLVDGSQGRVRMFQPTGDGTTWKQVSQGHSGRVFRNWESPAGTINTYVYSATNAAVNSISVRAHQVLVGSSSLSLLLEHGWHAIETRQFEIDPPCSTRPVSYRPIGAYQEGSQRIGDFDGDGLSDFAEIYFGTSMDSLNQLEAGLKPTLVQGENVKVRWPRVDDPNLLVTARTQWSTNLVDWSEDGVVAMKVGEEPDTGREIMEVTLPNTGTAAYLRLLLSTPPPPETP